jgi:hypothetical protein
VLYKLKHNLKMRKEIYELPEDGQKLRSKYVKWLINKQKLCATTWCQILRL